MSRQWSRAHDAHLAKVEGLWTAGASVAIPRYNTDLTAAFRALEAWRGKDKDREYVLYSHSKLVLIGYSWQPWATLADLPQAIAWALYDATGGAAQ